MMFANANYKHNYVKMAKIKNKINEERLPTRVMEKQKAYFIK